ncbi:MAG: CCA tRNA nucleotidyltransferase [Candidatus Omnitrophica bacterium]|nr:CCA tRNA nucleotidyltransferase [Candidatus Omnitrophota bacterium]
MLKTAIFIIRTLRKAGYDAYLAGGCVRDILMNKKPDDFDIATSAKPEEIEGLFKKTKPVGKKFGVILVVKNGHTFEVATFRSDFGYSDRRRPDAVFFTNAMEDALRRDFTVNGMFYDPIRKEVLDYVEGQKDLKLKTIRFIGDPNKRIKEDNLRILRAIRLKNVLDFKYEKKTLNAVKKNIKLIKNVSLERIRDELNKMFESKNRVLALKDMDKIGILRYILPEIEEMKGVRQPEIFHSEGDVYTHTIKCLENLPRKCDLNLVWAVLLHDVGKPKSFSEDRDGKITFYGHIEESVKISEKILRRLRFSKKDIEEILWLIDKHMTLKDVDEMRIAKRRRLFLDSRFKKLLLLYKADGLGCEPKNLEIYNKTSRLYKKDKLFLKRARLKRLVSGDEIMREFNLKEGPKIGRLLKRLEDAQLEGKVKTKKEAIKFLRRIA